MNSAILHSWETNAAEWIATLQQAAIASRRVTNPAIVEAILQHRPTSVCDIGCGEGWLTRTLAAKGIDTVGVDGTPALVVHAQQTSSEPYHVLSYEEIIEGAPLPQAPFEAAVFNFCLYQEEETPLLLKAVAQQLKGKALVFIQTLHPFAFAQQTEIPYKNQWFSNAWQGLSGSFTDPHAWYFRTMGGWMQALEQAGLRLLNLLEPLAEEGERPVSTIFIAQPNTTIIHENV